MACEIWSFQIRECRSLPRLILSTSVRLKPIVTQPSGMIVMVTLLLFSLSIKSEMADKQVTVCQSASLSFDSFSHHC